MDILFTFPPVCLSISCWD